jgi:hypothetical protein
MRVRWCPKCQRITYESVCPQCLNWIPDLEECHTIQWLDWLFLFFTIVLFTIAAWWVMQQ